MSVQEKALELLDYLELQETDDNKKWRVVMGAPEEFKSFILNLHHGAKNDDWILQFVNDALTALAEFSSEPVEPFIEPDIFANQLTTWLASNERRIHYITKALAHERIIEGFEVLQKAQYIEKKEIFLQIKEFLGA